MQSATTDYTVQCNHTALQSVQAEASDASRFETPYQKPAIKTQKAITSHKFDSAHTSAASRHANNPHKHRAVLVRPAEASTENDEQLSVPQSE